MFQDREEAGRRLAERLKAYRGRPEALVLGVVPGGAIVGSAVAKELGLPLDALIVQKLRVPDDPEAAFGAVTEDGTVCIDEQAVRRRSIAPEAQERELRFQRNEAAWRRHLYRGGRPLPSLAGRAVLLIDEGAVTAAPLLAAADTVRMMSPSALVLGVPVLPLADAARLQERVDALEVLEAPKELAAVGSRYASYGAVPHGELVLLLSAGHRPRRATLTA